MEPGRYPLMWRARYLSLPFGPEIRGTTEVACSGRDRCRDR
jgi:hypothetical protein